MAEAELPEAEPAREAYAEVAGDSQAQTMASEPTAKSEPPRSLASRFEELFGKKLPIWAGGITLAIAGVLIVKYAADAGFFARIFTHGVQVFSGILFGLGLIAGAEFAYRNEARLRDIRVPQALSGAGIATLYAATLMAANVYDLIGPATAFAALAAITGSALGLSLRFGAPSAVLGLVGGLAAPALVGAMEPNVPQLSVYLGLTIAGLVGVSRMRRWPWLALAAILGGAGWSLWMVLASNALDTIGSLSVGGFVLLLAVALPMLAFDGARSVVLRSASAVIGALQLALLVAYGGFTPLHWGLFGLIAAAGQFLASRDKNFGIVPSISLALSALLLAIWPDPTVFWFATVGLSLAAIHALPLLARLWQTPANLQRTLELCALSLAAPLLAKWQFWTIADTRLASIALGAAAVAATGIALGWKRDDRKGDNRFALLTASAALLLAVAAVLVVPSWQAPLAIAAIAIAVLFFGKVARDRRIEGVAAGFAGATLPALIATMPTLSEVQPLLLGAGKVVAVNAVIRWLGLAALFALFAAKAVNCELRFASLIVAGALTYATLAQVVAGWSLPLAMGAVALVLFGIGQYRSSRAVERLSAGFGFAGVTLLAMTGRTPLAEWGRLSGSDAAVTELSVLRWGGLALLALLYAVRARSADLQRAGQVAAALLGYGTLAQVVPGQYLAFIPALGGAVLLLAARWIEWPRLAYAVAVFAAVSLGWAFVPLVTWINDAALSFGGIPMVLDPAVLGPRDVIARLAAPALLFGGALWHVRSRLPKLLLVPALAACASLATIAFHCLYRLGFAQAFGADFVQTGLGERLIWEALLIAGGWLAMWQARNRLAFGLAVAGTAHAVWYTLLLHNPLWTPQAVGSLPLANMLIPAFAMAPLGLLLIARLWPDRPVWTTRVYQLFAMTLVAGFAWASLRQAFHGTLLTDPGVASLENILRSILLLALAIGYLLWGIRTKRHDWRIASLVLMLGAVGKVFLFDASGLEGLTRIGSFVALGFSLIGIGWLYSRQLAAAPSGNTDD